MTSVSLVEIETFYKKTPQMWGSDKSKIYGNEFIL